MSKDNASQSLAANFPIVPTIHSTCGHDRLRSWALLKWIVPTTQSTRGHDPFHSCPRVTSIVGTSHLNCGHYSNGSRPLLNRLVPMIQPDRGRYSNGSCARSTSTVGTGMSFDSSGRLGKRVALSGPWFGSRPRSTRSMTSARPPARPLRHSGNTLWNPCHWPAVKKRTASTPASR
jgi:hypothetical protein